MNLEKRLLGSGLDKKWFRMDNPLFGMLSLGFGMAYIGSAIGSSGHGAVAGLVFLALSLILGLAEMRDKRNGTGLLGGGLLIEKIAFLRYIEEHPETFQDGHHQTIMGTDDDVRRLKSGGEYTAALRLYRELHPDVSLQDAMIALEALTRPKPAESSLD